MGELDNYYSDLSSYVSKPVQVSSNTVANTLADLAAGWSLIPDIALKGGFKAATSFLPVAPGLRKIAGDVLDADTLSKRVALRQSFGGSAEAPSNIVTDIANTATQLGTGAAAFIPDILSKVATKYPIAIGGSPGLGLMSPETEKYLTNIPQSPFAEAFHGPTTSQVGPVQGGVQKVFSTIEEGVKKNIVSPMVSAGLPKIIEPLMTEVALGALMGAKAPEKPIASAKVKETVKAPEGEMVKVGPEETVVAPEVIAPKVPPSTDASILLHQEKALLQDKLAETTTAQGKRKINKQIAEIDKSIGELIAQEQAPKYEVAIDELNKYYESSLLDMAKEQTRKAWAEKKAKKLAEEAEIPVESIGETLPGETPQTIGIPSETPDYWSILKGEPKDLVSTKETTLQNETKVVEPEVKASIEDSRFTPDEITLRDNLYDAKESYLDTKEALIDSLTETNPDLLKPERLPDLMKELNNYPEFQKARTAMESAQRILDEHLGAKPGSIESAVAQVLTEQPKVPESRKIGDTLNDVLNIAKETIKGERGELGSREMSPEAKASWERLNQDAQRLGRSIEDHLKSLKFPDRVIKEMTGKMPSAGGTIVKSVSDIQKAIDPDNLNADKTYTHTTRTGEKVLVQFPKVDVATATALYHTPEVGRGPLTNAIYFFDKLGGPWKELYDNYNAAKTQEIRNVKAAEKEIVELRKKYNNQELKDAYIYSVARRAGGIERLQASGIQIPEFVPKRVAELSHSFDSKFAFLFDRLNEMRVRNGLKPVERVKNYITFFGDVNKISEKLGSDAWVMPDLMKAVKEGIADTSFQFAKKADKKGAGIDAEMDILKAYHKYVKTAERHINIQPIVSRGKTYLQDWYFDTRTGAPTDGFWSVERKAPKTATAIEKWLNTIGRGSKERLILSKEHASLLGKVQRNLSGAYVGANINTVLSQASSLMMLPVAIGIQNIPRGLGILKPKNFELAGKLSNVLDMRSFKSEINNYAENVAEMGRTEGSLKAIREGVMVPAGLLDQSMAAYSWWASYKTALSRGLTKEKAARFADDVTVKTQGSGDIGHVAPIQTSVEGSALTMLQTYKIAFGNFLYHEILANPKISKAEVIKRSIIAFGSMMAMNMAYNALGLKSPNPEPEWDYKKFTEAGFSSPASVGLSAAKFAGQTFMGNQDRAGYQSPLLDLGYQSMKIPLTPEAIPSALTNIAATTIGAATGLPTMALKRLATKEGTARFFTSQPEEREGKITPF